jgi:hypothetical protein
MEPDPAAWQPVLPSGSASVKARPADAASANHSASVKASEFALVSASGLGSRFARPTVSASASR